MIMHSAFQTDFADRLLAPIPQAGSKRFAVYRNNVFVSLVEALRARFPAVENAVGAEFFTAMARDYAASHPPSSPLMMLYGDAFPDFIARFPPLADYPWMSDLARVECAITESYHAADADPASADAFAHIAPEDLPSLRLVLHPALRLIPSRFAIATLWQMNRGLAEIVSLDDHPAETALIHRPHLTVSVKPLSTAGGEFLSALQAGECLADAADHAVAGDPTFDLAAHFHLLIADGLVLSLNPHDSPRSAV